MSIQRVCSACIYDSDLRAWIRKVGGPKGCDACGRSDAPTCELSALCGHIESCLAQYWGSAVEQLPYETAEGGYQGSTWDTAELLFDKAGLSLPRDRTDQLRYAILGELTDDLWCDYDWLTLDEDVALKTSWERFCETVKHRKRFFFHTDGDDERDSYTPASLLRAIASISERMGLISSLPVATNLWRARPDLPRGTKHTASDYGPPPPALALQSNRMNPPGIPMMYAASSSSVAILEARATEAMVGKWNPIRPLRILDLRSLPKVPGLFSGTDRKHRLTLRFLHHFSGEITKPVPRDKRVHVDYLPSQVVTEFFREFPFQGGYIEGIAYASAVSARGWNIALFADDYDLGIKVSEWRLRPSPSFRFQGATWKRI